MMDSLLLQSDGNLFNDGEVESWSSMAMAMAAAADPWCAVLGMSMMMMVVYFVEAPAPGAKPPPFE